MSDYGEGARYPRAAAESRAYKERVKAQTLAWAQGRPYHNRVDNECCPDFSCCQPAMFERDEGKRWVHFRQFHTETVQ